MREIKFRAWNGKGMIISGRTDQKYYIEASSGRVCWLERYDDDDWGMASTSTWKLMQYTGLKDKNGVEVYEGDILEQKLGEHKWRYIIRHQQDRGVNLYADTIYRNFSGGGDWEETIWKDYYVNERSNNPLHIDRFTEVIGNIYETPELLTKENNQ